MKLFRRPSILGFLLLLTIVLVCPLQASVPDDLKDLRGNQAELAKAWYQKIKNLRKSAKALKAVEVSDDFITWLNKQAKPEIRKQYKVLALESKAESHRSAMQFTQAAATYKRLYAVDKQDKWVYAKANAEKKRLQQVQQFKTLTRMVQNREKLAKKLLDVARERKQLMKNFETQHKGKEPTPQDMKKLRDQVKKLAEERQAIKDKMEASRKKQFEITRKYRQQAVALSPAQKGRMQPQYANIDKMLDSAQNLQNKSNEDLLSITESFHYTWKGMQEVFARLPKQQEAIRDLQKKFFDLAKKKPLNEAQEARLVELKQRIDQKTRQMERLLGDLEESFMKSDSFQKLTKEQRAEFLKNLKAFKDAQRTIDNAGERVAKLFKNLRPDRLYGDLNKDGKIDQADLDLMEGVMYRIPIQPGEDGYRRAYDLNGDGNITMADWCLLSQAVNGKREHFPADPKTLKGDIDGDGKLTAEDVRRLSWHFVRYGHRKNRFVRPDFDLNGDGKFTLNDVRRLANQVPEVEQVDRTRLDVNGDGKVNAMDLIKIMEIATAKRTITDPAIRKAADLNGDGKVNALDIVAWGKSHQDTPIVEPQQPDPESTDEGVPPVAEAPEIPEEQGDGDVPAGDEPPPDTGSEPPADDSSESSPGSDQDEGNGDAATDEQPADTDEVNDPHQQSGTEDSAGTLMTR